MRDAARSLAMETEGLLVISEGLRMPEMPGVPKEIPIVFEALYALDCCLIFITIIIALSPYINGP